ncbi:MAG: T9SS type A sorting domain-containing protein [Bacteroidetes bacterium]|jgi:hypothetical protein|nr:T9SS type A sorting domain-containing protein [Bacteroidota bacterium]
MKKIILIFGLLVTCWQINAQDYCTDGGPSSTFDSNVESVDLVGETTTIAYLGCQNAGNGVAGVEDLTSSQTADIVAGNSYTVDVQYGTCGGNFASAGEAWIDYDRDGTFEASESIGTVNGTPPFALQSFSVTVPNDAVNGNSRMRVMQWEGGALPLDPCGSFTWGSVTDFEIVISGGIDITCEQPFNVQLVEAFGSSADFTWDLAPNDQNGYIWEVFAAGADPDVDTPVSTGTVGSGVNTVNADGLSELTDYDFYVITDCGSTDGLSQRSNVVQFTTDFLCPAPTNVTIDGLVADAFNINWTEIPNASSGYTWSVFNSGDDPAVDTPVSTGSVPFGTTTANVTALTDNTTYDVYVSADCDADGTSELSNVVTVTTPCVAFTAPVAENFDGANWVSGTGFGNAGDAIDDCWQRTPDGSGFFWGTRSGTTGSTGTGPDSANSGSNYIYTEGSNGIDGDEAFFVSPLIDLSPLTNPALTFWYHMHGGDMGTLSVDVDAGSGFDLDVFTISGEQQTAESDPFIQQIVDLAPYAGQTVRIRFRGVKAGGFATDMAIDDFEVDEAPSCFTPTGIAVSNITQNTADFSWDANSSATDGYNWFVFNAGDDPAVDTPVASGSVGAGVTTANVTGLPSSSALQFYVQSDCGTTNGLSDLSPALDFDTLCDIFPTPYFEDFANFTVTTSFVEDGCWEEASPDIFTWDVATGGTPSTGTGPNNALFGDNYIFTESSSGTLGDEAIVLTPEIDLSGLTNPSLSFWYHMFGADMGTLHVDVDDGTNLDLSVFSISGQQQTAQADPWFEEFVDLSPYAGQTIQVRFRVERGDGFESDVAIDGVNFDEAPTCLTPTGLTVTNEGISTADISWDAIANASAGYNWLVFNQGDDPAVDTPVATGSVGAGVTTATISGLSAATTYDVYIQANCGATDGLSDLSPAISLETLCDVFVAPYFEDFETFAQTTSLVEDECWTEVSTDTYAWDVSNSDTPSTGTGPNQAFSGNNFVFTEASSGSVGDEALLLSPQIDVSSLAAPALSFYYHMFGINMGTIHVDVDAGSGFDLDVFTLSGQQQANQGDPWIQQFVDLSAYAGQTITIRLRAERGDGFESDISIDDFSVDEAPPCLKPTNLALVDVFFDSAEVSWAGIGNAVNGYIWEVYNAGDDPATATPVSTGTFAAGSTQGIADGLTPETDYDLYLISDCGPDGQSDLTNPISFTTTELCSLPSTFEVVNLQPDSAELNWSSIPNATNGYLWAVFNAGDDPATATPVDSGAAGSGDTSAIATGLTDNTPYDAYITTDCGADGQSDQSLPVSFTTPCNVFSAPITEDFESTSWVPGTGFGNTGDAIDACWSRDPESPDYFWGTRTGTTSSTGTGPDSANSGANYVFTESSNGSLGDEAFLVSPLIDLSPLSDPALSFWYHMFGGDIGTINVDVNAGSGYDLAVFTLSGQQQTAGNEPWIEQFVDLSAYAGQTVQIRFRAVRGDGFGSDIAIDDFQVDEAPSCLTPTGLTVTNITENTADLSWNAIGNASAGYNWFIFNAGDDPAVDPPVASGSTAAGVTSDNVTGLPSSSFLEAYIQANCGTADGLSELSPAVSFETLCDVFPTPYFEDFENFTVSTTFDEDGCWDEDSSGAFTWDVGTGGTGSLDTGPDAAFSGANYLFTEASSGSLGDEAIVLSPEVDLSSLSTPALSFRYHMYGAEIDQLSIDIDDGTTLDLDVLTIVGEQQSSETDDWIQTFVDLSPYAGQTIQVRFRVTRGDGFAGDVAIDDVNFDEAPTCFDPLNLEVLSVSDTTADLSWQPGSSETNFDVEVVLAGTTPTGVPTFEDVSVPFTATGLNSETDYDFYVRADCGPGDVSNWVGPESFTTAITPVSVIVNDPAINNTYCYDNNEFKEWLFVSSDGTTAVEVVFNGGTIEDGTGSTDRFRVFDGFDDNAPVLYDSDVDGTDLSGVSLTANSGAAYMLLESDIFGSCQSGIDIEVPFDFDVFAGTMSTVAFSEDNFKYYPNPVESILNIESANPVESVQIFDILGKEVFSQDYENLSVNINMNALSSGTYLMKVSISGNSQTFRVIKE